MTKQTVTVGSVVTYRDSRRVDHVALVTAVWGDTTHDVDTETRTGNAPSLNLVYVEPDEARHDQYGNQLARETSVVHLYHQAAGANCWLLPDG